MFKHSLPSIEQFAAYLDGKKLREIQYAHELQHILWVLGLDAELKI